MRIGSLCSGIGGLELGLEWAGLGHTIWHVERDKFCQRMLRKHWPTASLFDDVRRVGAKELEPVDLICFGFPCQDVSSAGRKTGLTGARSGLFYECARIVGELAPEWVVIENVASGAKLWVDECRGELERLGYASLPIPIEARDVGALHRRARVFVVAHGSRRGAANPDGVALRLNEQRQAAGRAPRGVRNEGHTISGFPGWSDPEPDVVRVVHGVPEGLDTARRGALGNAVVPQCAEVVGHVIRKLAHDCAGSAEQ